MCELLECNYINHLHSYILVVCRRTWSLARQHIGVYTYIYGHVTYENFLRKSIFKCVYGNVLYSFHLLAACPNTLIFTSTPVGETRTLKCSTLSDLLYSGIISARCGGDGEWESLTYHNVHLGSFQTSFSY